MVKRPTGSGGEPSSPNCESSAGVKARHLQYSGRCFFKLTITCAVSTNPAPYFDANAAHRLAAPSITKVPKVRLVYEPRENMTATTALKKSPIKHRKHSPMSKPKCLRGSKLKCWTKRSQTCRPRSTDSVKGLVKTHRVNCPYGLRRVARMYLAPKMQTYVRTNL